MIRGIPPSIGTPLDKGDPPAYRHPPYQGGQGGSNLKSIFNLIITSYLIPLDKIPALDIYLFI
ncbi:MAG: hypothetical protein EWV58_06305 [Microcystis aeruginosa Ma_MB_F_20061100_S19]|nr:MAG: hypothetical protein EWV59_08100 [Microcystis aeruginosa Ma_MB_F_20061100_S19D]TRU16852.1 MAG: hypothetical protein EWV58_06305 [Microcystis aeruginosa Ma_MB_F_20061100_S19]